ncbi:MAG: SAM-dependent methyltransferase, partial [Oscillospiraceae bacterium]|nr:SAM-dependent methyltransferase [Oscillospiraceae bacterium]
HEINAQIQKGGDFDLLLGHGLLRERFSALLTDAIRAAVLEDMGYSVDVIEFIDFEHSPKNLMLRAVKNKRPSHRRLDTARALADKYGFRQTLLELVGRENG